MEIRPYATEEYSELWSLKRAFELGLGDGTGGDDKREKYEAKLTDDYRERYREWVDRCVAEDERAVHVAESDGGELVGYAFVLPASLSMIWDAAVLNEIYVAPDHRGTGVADELLEAALDAARAQELPLDRIVLDVDGENERARAFYERFGFAHWGEMVAREL
ncbi:GNAT family N-acetyltransferase [Haloprofundus sp. MHR1]|uniref:GNAT family N-acetyltransferase n=1 Tax=Haloprofundus sp. MHR1 TaxID=2572921 RepID=UPI0010BF1138|nr:GNAT family N-acetyltransferase [Haloprofundus sp. MHR1]QCJ46381.1 GNAT family N-acetyltransferase [Haloprofundus sp. MHR1]